MKQLGVFVTIPFVLAVPPVLGWYFGEWIDRYFGITPYAQYTLIVLGFAAGFKEVYRLIKKYGNDV